MQLTPEQLKTLKELKPRVKERFIKVAESPNLEVFHWNLYLDNKLFYTVKVKNIIEKVRRVKEESYSIAEKLLLFA